MSFSAYLREITRGTEGSSDLSQEEAYRLYSAMLDGGVPDLELGAILLTLHMKTEGLSELLGFHHAVTEREYHLRPALSDYRTVVIPTYNGARRQPNLVPLLALLLQRFGVPVLLHGTLEGNGRIATAYILRELGIMPKLNLAQAQQALDTELLAFVPTAVLCPGLANLLALRSRLGVRNSAHTLVKLIDPVGEQGVRVVSVSHPDYLVKMRAFLSATGYRALLLRGTEGEPFANPKRRPKLEYFCDGEATTLFEAEVGPIKALPSLPATIDAGPTAAWIRRVLAGEALLPHPIANHLACCLFASGYTDDMNQAKAIAAVEAGSLVGA